MLLWYSSGRIKAYDLRDGWRHPNGWIFGKVPNGLWPPPSHFRKIMLQFFSSNYMHNSPVYKSKSCSINFLIEMISLPPLRKFSENSSLFIPSPVPKGSIQYQIPCKGPFPPICPHRITSGGFFHHSNVNWTTHDVISAIFFPLFQYQ